MKDLMICNYKKCNKYLCDPILLPCSNNVCKLHVDDIIKGEHKQFKCLVCDNEHKTPEDGFVLNTFITRISEYNFHLNDAEKQLSESLDKLKEEIYKSQILVQHPENYIFEKTSSMRNKIDLERQRLISEINTLSSQMINQVNKYETECIENINKLKDSQLQFNNRLVNATNGMIFMKEELRSPKIEKTKVDELIKQSNEFIEDIKEKCSNYKNILLMEKIFSINENNPSLSQNLFGNILLSSSQNNESPRESVRLSSSILSQTQCDDLIKLCEFDSQNQFKLLYRATINGFSSKNFHAKCDGISNTLTIIKVKGSPNIFGGYTSATWEKNTCYKSDQEAFIFSLINNINCPLKIKVTDTEHSIRCCRAYGPTFGAGKDIFISNNSNENDNSYSNLGQSYTKNLFAYDTIKPQNLLAGSLNFTTEEIEVFQVI